jgi:hypothetical protein
MRGYVLKGAACVSVTVPAHAYLTEVGDAWKCSRGYRQVGESCLALKIPEHAHIDFSGNDLECDRGFEPQGRGAAVSACIPVSRLNECATSKGEVCSSESARNQVPWNSLRASSLRAE